MAMKSARGILLAGILLFSSAACLLYLPDADWSSPSRVFQQNVSLDPGGAVSLENETGYIEIRGWDQKSVEITAEENGFPAFGRRMWFSQGSMSTPRVEVDTLDNFVKIVTRATSRETIVRPVHYSLRVPHSVILRTVSNKEGDLRIADVYGEIRAEIERGDIRIENCSGSLDLSLDQGAIEAEILDVQPDDEIKVTVREGDITLFLQPEANIAIEAAALRGRFSSEFDPGRPLTGRKIQTRIGKSEGATASLTTLSGNISLKKIR
jgi:hypothetical protein